MKITSFVDLDKVDALVDVKIRSEDLKGPLKASQALKMKILNFEL